MISIENFFNEEIVLENERARLSPMSLESFELLDKIAYDPRIWAMGLSQLTSPDQLKAYIITAMDEKSKGQSYPFIIYDKKEKRIAGSTRFGSISLPNKRVEIGWTWLHPDFHGTGLNKACKFLLLQFAFETLQLNRVELKTDALNWQSRKAMMKLGAREEGIFRKHMVTSTGRIRDSIYFSITNEDWPSLKQTVFVEF